MLCYAHTYYHLESKTVRSIPFFNVLWASATKVDLSIHYAKPTSKKDVCVAYIDYTLDPSSTSDSIVAKAWVDRLLERAYGQSQRQKRIKVLINPYGGSGKAAKWFARDIEPIFAAAQCTMDLERTAYMGHAIEIAEKIDENAYDAIACCSGDGTPHEVFNGLARKANAAEALRKIAVLQLPCGSGNAMSWNLNGTGSTSMAALCVVKGLRTPFDLASVTQGEKRTISFLSQAVGVVAESDLGTDNIRWMGAARFTYGFFVRLLGKTVYPCDIAVKTCIASKLDIKTHYAAELSTKRRKLPPSESASTALPPLQHGSILDPLPRAAPEGPFTDQWSLTPYRNLGNFYAGNMTIMAESAPFFPASLPHDGLLDLVTIPGDISRLKAISLLLSVEKGTFFDTDVANFRKVAAYRVVPKFGRWREGTAVAVKTSRAGKVLKALGISGGSGGAGRDGGFISIDGEKMPFEPFQVEVHKGLGTTLSRSGFVYESPGPAGWEELLPKQAAEEEAAEAES